MRAPRRSTGTPRARVKGRRPTSPTPTRSRQPMMPVRKRPDVRPTKLGGTKGGTSKRMLPPGMDIPKKTPEEIKAELKKRGGGTAYKAGSGKSYLRDLLKKKKAGKARSTGTPKAPTRTARPTTATPTRRSPSSAANSRNAAMRKAMGAANAELKKSAGSRPTPARPRRAPARPTPTRSAPARRRTSTPRPTTARRRSPIANRRAAMRGRRG